MRKKEVAVAMSGGVDSAVAAALLKKDGFKVIGLTMKLWRTEECGKEKRRSCCSLRDVEDARAVARKLEIPFYVINLYDEFEREVIQYFLKEYRSGRTPNPCIVCNTCIKFGTLWQKARQLGAAQIATGHYARVKYNKKKRRYLLYRGKDEIKDQSYVLFELNQEQLASAIFPVGDLKKSEVRTISEDLGLPVCRKVESQEICFILNKDYRSFLEEKGITDSRGYIKDFSGKVIGRHKGLHAFTIGQRKKLGLSGGPYYVLSINPLDNSIIVGREKDLERNILIASKLNWIDREKLDNKFPAEVKIRYNHNPADAFIYPVDRNRVRVEFVESQKAITPGQAVVFYQGARVSGGGWIDKSG